MIKILEIILLIIPSVAWKLWNDRNGTIHPNKEPIHVFFIMSIFVFICGVTHILITPLQEMTAQKYFSLYLVMKLYAVSITGFGLIFPYTFNYLWFNKMYNNTDLESGNRFSYIVNHLSNTAIPDKWFLKYNVHWAVRLAIYIALFIGALIWFL